MAEQLFSWSHQELRVQFDVWIRFCKNTHCFFLLIIFCYKNRLAKSRVHYRLHDTVLGNKYSLLNRVYVFHPPCSKNLLNCMSQICLVASVQCFVFKSQFNTLGNVRFAVFFKNLISNLGTEPGSTCTAVSSLYVKLH